MAIWKTRPRPGHWLCLYLKLLLLPVLRPCNSNRKGREKNECLDIFSKHPLKERLAREPGFAESMRMSVAAEPSSDGIYFCLVRQLCSARLNTWDYKGKTKHGNGDRKLYQNKSGS